LAVAWHAGLGRPVIQLAHRLDLGVFERRLEEVVLREGDHLDLAVGLPGCAVSSIDLA
jgi:hypothetical protein